MHRVAVYSVGRMGERVASRPKTIAIADNASTRCPLRDRRDQLDSQVAGTDNEMVSPAPQEMFEGDASGRIVLAYEPRSVS